MLDVLPDPARVALLADWGTGMPDARALLEQVARLRPDVVLHLGDIYYSGTPHEVRAHFLDLFEEVFGARRPPLFALAGNHDRYSGGEGYRQLLQALGQPASYFCLRNRHWQLLAMDTGLHDPQPPRGGPQPHHAGAGRARVAARQAAARGRAAQRAAQPPPPLLLQRRGAGRARAHAWRSTRTSRRASRDLLARVALWFWGHEHDLLVFAPWAGLARGRCIGASAVPRLAHQQRRTPLPGLLLPAGEPGPPTLLPGTRLADDGLLDFHAWALLELQGASATVSYYQADCRELQPGRAPPARPAPLHRAPPGPLSRGHFTPTPQICTPSRC